MGEIRKCQNKVEECAARLSYGDDAAGLNKSNIKFPPVLQKAGRKRRLREAGYMCIIATHSDGRNSTSLRN